jgi:geranylgeranyl pyrophosphate synthase
LKQGTVTLPLMLARQSTNGQLDAVLAKPVLDDADYAEVVRIVRNSSSIDESYAYAKTFGDKARAELAAFSPSAYRDALESLTYYVVGRRN